MNSCDELITKPTCIVKRKRRNNMPHAEKEALIEAIKLRPPIWDKVDPKHSDTTAVNACWREISVLLKRSGRFVKVILKIPAFQAF